MRAIPILVTLGAVAVAAPTQVMAQDFEWSGRLSAGQAIEVKGINGDIEALVARRRLPPFEADASTILAHWIRSAATDDAIVVELDREDLVESLADARAELAPLLDSLG